MAEYFIDFKNIAWESHAPGVRQKVYISGNDRVRLVEFSEGFFEENWCTNGHIGYVLEGRISIDFNGNVIAFSAGDGIFIPEGEQNKHKGKIIKGEKALLILFEKV